MVWQFVAAGVLALIASAVHGAFGERRVLPDVVARGVLPAWQATLRVVWHMVTLTFLLSGLWLFRAEAASARLIGFLFLAYAVWSAAFVIRRDARLLVRAPQWLLFGGIAALALWGAGSP